MKALSPRVRFISLALILLGLMLVIGNKPDDPTTLIVIGVIVGMIVLAVIVDRIPRFQSILRPLYIVVAIGLAIFSLFFILMTSNHSTLHFGISPSVSLLVAIPFVVILLIFFLGPILVGIGQPNAAETWYSFLIRLRRNFGFAYYQRGVLRHNRKDVANALEDYSQALHLASTNTPSTFSLKYNVSVIHLNKTALYIEKGDFQQAALECSKGLVLNDSAMHINMLLHFNRGYARLIMGASATALADFNAVRFEGTAAPYEATIGPAFNALKALVNWELERRDEAGILWTKAVQANTNFNDPDWLRDKLKWPPALIELAVVVRDGLSFKPLRLASQH